MVGNEEAAPAGEGPPGQPPIEPTEIERNPVINPLAIKLNSIRADSHTRIERISTLLNISADQGSEGIQETDPIPVDSLLSQVDELYKAKLTPAEYLLRSNQLLQASEQAQKRAIAEEHQAYLDLYGHNRIIRDINDRLGEIEKLNRFKKLTKVFERKKLGKQKAQLEQQASTSQTLIDSKRQIVGQAHTMKHPIRQEQERVVFKEAVSDIEAIRANYEEFLGEVLQDGNLTSQIQEIYIRDVISPKLNDPKIPEDKKVAFYTALQNALQHHDAPYQEKQVLHQELNKFISENGLYDLRDAYQPLLNGEDKDTVTKLIAKIAISDISKIKSALESRYGSYNSKRNLEDLLSEAIDPGSFGWTHHNPSFREIVRVELNSRSGGNYPNMRLWRILKVSPIANELFGDLIKTEDERIFAIALEKSLYDTQGTDIQILSSYPRPEAIRNLVILAAADYANYRTVHANSVLSYFAKRPDWNQILDQTISVYPALASARPMLEKWTFSEYGSQPGIQQAVDDFALSIFSDDQVDKRLVGLATASLSNFSLLDILHKRGVIPDNETISTLKDTEKLLVKLSNDWRGAGNDDQERKHYISGDSLKTGLRENLFNLLYNSKDRVQQSLDGVRQLAILSKKILENQQDYNALDYFTSRHLVKKLEDTLLSNENIDILLSAYQKCPALTESDDLLAEFCNQFIGEESVKFFKDMSVAYGKAEDQLLQIVRLVGSNSLEKSRALEIPVKAKDILQTPLFSLAIEFPQLFLGNDDGLDFLKHTNTASLFSLDKGLEIKIGERIRILQREGKIQFSELLKKIVPNEITQIDTMLSAESPIEGTQQNWQQLLMGYVRIQSAAWGLPNLSQVSTDKLNVLFKDPKVRDLCLNGLRDSWSTYLKSGKPEEVPFSLNLMSEFINYCRGAGPLSQIDSLNNLISTINKAYSKGTTAERTKFEITQGILTMENRFTKERWSNEDRTDFYNISRDILGAAPSLFTDYLSLFEKLNPSQMKLFAKDIYPLYRAKLVLLEKQNKEGLKVFDTHQLVQIRQDIRNFASVFNAGEKPFEVQKQKLLEEIKNLFKDRFGIIKIPQEFSLEHIRSFTNVSGYLANLASRNSDKEIVLGFYLSLMINDNWDKFRRGETVEPGEYLIPEKSKVISALLEKRQRFNPLVPENLGISSEDMPEFLKLLQQETQNMVIGNIETIDIKLTNVILNLKGLEDLDLYPDLLDKQRMQLLMDWGNKKVGSVVARMYQSLAAPGKPTQFSEEDSKIQQQIAHIISESGLNLTQQALKEHFQDGIRPLATVVNLLHFVEETRAEPEVETLRDLLKPSSEVIDTFKRLGEDFKPTSGALALSQDLKYLDNLIVKREDELEPQEKALLVEYTTNIRTQIVKLEGVYDQIKNKFGSLKQGSNASKNPLLQDKLTQIDKIISAESTQQAITSTVTNNLNVIIENIRECLSCTRGGFNNDTNLTFGDMNKFYLYSQSETQQTGSISDQLVFVEPITKSDGTQEIAFVLDRIYGSNTPTVLENQIEAVLKKCRVIKQRFPDAKLSVFVTDAAITTGGTSQDMLLERLKSKKILAAKEAVNVNVVESAAGDHYIEFSGNSRVAGKRDTNGIVI